VSSATAIRINLDQALYVLSDGLDFVGIDDNQHGKRVACMALQTSAQLTLDDRTRHDLYYAALIHDIGVSSTEAHHHLVNELEWQRLQDHCDAAATLLRPFRPLSHLAELLRYHHAHWDTLTASPLSPREQRLANLIFLCDRVDAVRAQRIAAGDRDPAPATREVIASHRGTFFDPELVDAFMTTSAGARFWERLAPEPLERFFLEHFPPNPAHIIGLEDMHDLGRLFAHVVDAKSPYTARHSQGVAQIACLLARRLGFTAEEAQLVAIAALLHDLGKLRVPDAILDKSGPLDAEEQKVMRRHADDSYALLKRIDGFAAVAEWAGLHHETPRGDGYPETLRKSALPVQARIISVADFFQALG